MLLALGCGTRQIDLLVLTLHRAHLATPTGPVALEVGTKEHSIRYQANQEKRLVARYGDVQVRVGVLGDAQRIIVDAPGDDWELQVIDGESYYRLNDGDRVPIEFKQRPGSGRTHFFELPPPIANWDVSFSGGTLNSTSAAKIKEQEGDVHTVYIPFLVDDDAFAVDLEFSVAIETRRVGGAVGSP